MSNPNETEKQRIMQDVMNAVNDLGSINAAAPALGISRSHAQKYYKLALAQKQQLTPNQGLEFPKLADPNIPIDDLIARRKADFARKQRARSDRNVIRIKVKTNAPIGVAPFGDPHLDDDGTDLSLALEHADIVRETEGLYGMNVGDNQNLWIGRLAAQYAHQTTTAQDGWRLTEHFIKRVRDWICLVKGNHDHWAGVGDPLDWMIRDMNTIMEPYSVRICLEFPNGFEYFIWLRHDFSGHSMWNNVHGMIKAAKSGARCHLYIAGHKHCCGHHSEYDAEGDLMWHALRTAGYKFIDSYADNLGFQDSNVFQCPVIIIDPEANKPSNVSTVVYDTERGADILTFMRKQAA